VFKLLDQATGIQPDEVVSLRLVMSDTTTFADTARVPFVKQVLERVRALPGVQAAGVGNALPPRVAPLAMGVRVRSEGRDEFQALTLASITPGFLPALGARLVRGRMFRDADMESGKPVAILSESAARHLSPTEDPVGRPLVFPVPGATGGRNRRPEVVGIVGDIKYTGLDARSAASVYVLWPELPAGVGFLVVRASLDATTLGPALQRTVRDLGPSLPVPACRTLGTEILDSIQDRRIRLVPAIGFAVLALAVAMVGLSAAMSRAIIERRRELAIRGALGATPARALRMVLTEASMVTAAGVAVGLGIAAAVGRWIAQLLYGVTPHDPLTLGGVALLVIVAAAVASCLSASRVLSVDPLELLRTE